MPKVEVANTSSTPLTHSLGKAQVEGQRATVGGAKGPSHFGSLPQDGVVVEMSCRLKDFLSPI